MNKRLNILATRWRCFNLQKLTRISDENRRRELLCAIELLWFLACVLLDDSESECARLSGEVREVVELGRRLRGPAAHSHCRPHASRASREHRFRYHRNRGLWHIFNTIFSRTTPFSYLFYWHYKAPWPAYRERAGTEGSDYQPFKQLAADGAPKGGFVPWLKALLGEGNLTYVWGENLTARVHEASVMFKCQE